MKTAVEDKEEDCSLCEHYMLLKLGDKIELGCELGLSSDTCRKFEPKQPHPLERKLFWGNLTR